MNLLPKRGPGRPSPAANAKYEAKVDEFCELILELNSEMSFAPESRSWCYMLEPHGLAKGDFDKAQKLINDCRKDGRLPIEIVASDNRRATRGKCIAQHWHDCLYDPAAAGTNRQQVTLCNVYSCALRSFRPTSRSPIPASVLDYYVVQGAERAFYRSPDAAKRGFVEGNPVEEYHDRGHQ